MFTAKPRADSRLTNCRSERRYGQKLVLALAALLPLAALLLAASVQPPGAGAESADAYSPNTPELLTVSKAGNGSGTVTSDPAGIDCGSDCQHWYANNERVTLSAVADPGSVFVGWDPGGGPGCPGTGTCELKMASDKTVTAKFRKLEKFELAVTKSGSGTGTVLSDLPGIDCGADCSEVYEEGTIVTLSTDVDPGSAFNGWSGAGCSGQDLCVVTIDEAQTVNAEFAKELPALDTLEVSKSGDGSGAVTSDPAGIDCGSDCSEQFARGSMITLTATAEPGSQFSGWSGAGCSGSGSCVVTLDQSTTVDAQFAKLPPVGYELAVSKSGAGSGTVTSTPAGIDCGSDCSEQFAAGTPVTLIAEPDTGSTFEGWIGGGCFGTDPCLVTMSEAQQIEASFQPDSQPFSYQLNVVKTGNGEGRVTASPGDIDCGLLCSAEFLSGTVVTLTATAENGDRFVEWQGPCQDGSPCIVTINESKTVTAVFADPSPTEHLVSVAKNGGGDGSVQSQPNGISCGQACAEIYSDGTDLTLQASPDYASRFKAWNGGVCDQVEGRSCQIDVDSPKAVEAIFAPKPGGGAWARKVRPGLNTVPNPERRRMAAVKGICKLGSCRIRKVEARVVIRRQKRGVIPASWSGAEFAVGEKRIVKVRFPGRLWRQLGTRKSGTLVVSIGLTAADGRRAVTREIKIGIRR